MISTTIGQVFFQPKPIEESNPNSLVTGQIFVIDRPDERIYVYTILGMPITVHPGTYRFSIEQRPKGKGKPGINYWYKGHEAVKQG